MCRRLLTFLSALFALAAVFIYGNGICKAQTAPDASPSASDADVDLGEAGAPTAFLKKLKDKTVVFVFDVSGSMNDHGNLHRARAATITILRDSLLPGDHVALLTFGAGYKKIFETTIVTHADIAALVDQVPSHTEEGAGTNIRKPHHEALRIVTENLPHPGVILLLTDSFNDEPKQADAEYPNYLKYYTPGGQLTKYPKTAENRDYERLLRSLVGSGKLTQFGIGIKIAENGRPIERLPQAEPAATDTSDSSSEPAQSAPPAPQEKVSPLPYILAGLGVIGLGAGAFFVSPLMKDSVVRISGGPVGKKDFQIKNGQTVRIGGDGAAAAFDAYALPAAREPVAIIRGARGQLFIALSAPKGNQKELPGVYHNGLLLEREESLNYGDEIRISLPDATGVIKEYRLKFEDPRKGY